MKKTAEMREYITSGNADAVFDRLYGEHENARRRYLALLDTFVSLFGSEREVVAVSAPGRAEIGGNHTDHNHGCVLAAALRLDIIGFVSPRSDNIATLKSAGFPGDTVDLANLTPVDIETGHSASLLRGVAAAVKAHGGNIGGFDCCTVSDVLKGSGISSSAAFEVLVAAIFNHLYNGGKISHIDEAKYGQYAENVFFGKPSGLMDQMASAVGGFVGIDFADTSDPVVTPVDFDFSSAGHTLCIVDTGESHVDLTDEYASIKNEMISVAKFFGKDVLREVDESEFYENYAAIRECCGDRAMLRAGHFFNDSNRAVSERKALESGDFAQFLKLINESGQSSFMYNQNVYASCDPTHQGISVALALTERFLAGRGACRLQGGGFGGTIQAFIPTESVADYRTYIDSVFGAGACKPMGIRPDGSRVVI